MSERATDALEVIGVVALVVSGFLVAAWIGFAVVGLGCIGLSAIATRRKRVAAEEKRAREMHLQGLT